MPAINKELVARASARSLMSRTFDIQLRAEDEQSFIPQILIRTTDPNDKDFVGFHLRNIGAESNEVANGVIVAGIENIKLMAAAGFDTGVNDQLFPDLRKSAISPQSR